MSMNIAEFLASEPVSLPKSRDQEDFESYLQSILQGFLRALDQLTTDENVSSSIRSARSTIEALCDSVRSSVRRYMEGFPENSYNILAQGIEAVRPHIDRMGVTEVSPHILLHMYRIRVCSAQEIPRGGIFHVPFEHRHLVGSQRFSIPGLPCLYLGGSVWICWEELERPSFNEVHVSRFQATQPLRVLDFGFRPLWVREVVHSLQSFVVAYVVTWPLMAASSIEVLHKNSPFIPEYIVPQLLLQWVVGNPEYDGVKYFSTRVDQLRSAPNMCANFAFPARKTVPSGYCARLRDRFQLTQPISWPLVEHTDLPSSPSPNCSLAFDLAPGVPARYASSDFGRIEGKLACMECANL